MRFEKRNFMGIELDVLVGHPEHDLLFVATQVARAAGLKHPATVIQNFHNQGDGNKLQLEVVKSSIEKSSIDGHRIKSNTWLFDEPRVYAMLLRGHAPASEPFRKCVTEEVLPTMSNTRPKKEFLFTPIGTVEPYSSIAKPDYGQGFFASERGKYKINLTIDSDKAQPLIEKIVKLHEADYAKRLAEHKKNPPRVQRGWRPLLPSQGALPFIENDDGTVTFKFAGWASYEKDGELIPQPLRIVDTTGELIVDVPDIAPGSEGKVRFTVVPYGWNATVGASVKLQLEGFMLTKLVEFDDGHGDWIGQEEEAAL